MGRHQVVEELGRGGMGIVYRGFDPQLERDVAIKMVLDAGASGPDLERFQLEARASAQLRHPGIVTVYEVGLHQGRPYLVMDLVRGQTLDEARKRQSPTPQRVAEIVRDVALALEHAHEHGVVHRDVKPKNVMIASDGRVVLMDFGLARHESAQSQLTATGEILGTPSYMAPEQAEGDREAQGPHTDVYALGGLLYFMLSGQAPFEATSKLSVIKKVLFEEPTPVRQLVPDAPKDLATVAHTCLAKDPAERYASVGAVADDLSRFLAGEPLSVRPLGALGRAGRWVRRNKAVAILSLLLLLAVGVAVGVSVVALRGQSEPGHAPPAPASPGPAPAPIPPATTTTTTPTPSPVTPQPAASLPEFPADLPEEVLRGWREAATLQRSYAADTESPLTFRTELLGQEFVLIPPSTFTMGSPLSEPYRSQHAGNSKLEEQRTSAVAPFYLATTEVTVRQYRLYMKDYANRNPEFERPEFPVGDVPWSGAVGFCAWLSEQDTGWSYRLPTSTEWEYACRAGTQTAYHWGDGLAQAHRFCNVVDVAFLKEHPEKRSKFGGRPALPGSDGYVNMAPVGSYLPNAFGLFDMHGNIYEWVSDEVPDAPDHRLARGGSYGHGAAWCRSAHVRGFGVQGWSAVGLRLVAQRKSR